MDPEQRTQLMKCYSNNNVLVTKEFVESTLQNVLDRKIAINDLTEFQKAFIHKSVTSQMTQLPENFSPTENYERLEFLGDGFLKGIIGEYMYDRFPNQQEGFLTKMRIKIERGSTLAYFANELNFKRYILLSQYIEDSSGTDKTGRNAMNLSEDVFEAFCGAILKDLGYTVLKEFVIAVIEKYIDFSELVLTEDNWKDVVSRYFQRIGLGYPVYTLISTSENPINKTRKFVSGINWIPELDDYDLPQMLDNCATTEERFLTIGHGETKKESEQCAARLALVKLKEYKIEEQVQAINEQKMMRDL